MAAWNTMGPYLSDRRRGKCKQAGLPPWRRGQQHRTRQFSAPRPNGVPAQPSPWLPLAPAAASSDGCVRCARGSVDLVIDRALSGARTVEARDFESDLHVQQPMVLLLPRDGDAALDQIARLDLLGGVDHEHLLPPVRLARRSGGQLDHVRRRRRAAPLEEAVEPSAKSVELRGHVDACAEGRSNCGHLLDSDRMDIQLQDARGVADELVGV
mmetsp:Transcript_2621/g.5898  ORF Transcript_2621/g.5898 Transcript_2621/m.5898 type:complete len:212 (+) Transcript_2621:394-1029(+)